jgi:predicted ATP-grasp superfamily ATP-dependent carboligase
VKDKVNSPEQAAQEHVWQYEHEVVEAEAETTVKVAEGTQIVGPDGKLYTAGQSLKVPASVAGQHVAAGRATPGRKAA